MGIFDFFKKPTIDRRPQKEIDQQLSAQIKTLKQEQETANSAEALTPATLAGKKRRYHYQDVNIWVSWEYGGQYKKSCKSIGMKRGDTVELCPPTKADEDREAIAVVWKGIEIGHMKSNRLRSMVHQWKSAGLPVITVVSQVGGEGKLYLEFAFYGTPKK